jgi:hypothetical protein
MTFPPVPVDTHRWDGTRNLPAWLDRHHHWDGPRLVIHTLDGDARPQPGWTFIHWSDDAVAVCTPRIADREYGPDGPWVRAERAEAVIGRVQDAAALHRQRPFSTAELYAVIEGALAAPQETP